MKNDDFLCLLGEEMAKCLGSGSRQEASVVESVTRCVCGRQTEVITTVHSFSLA